MNDDLTVEERLAESIERLCIDYPEQSMGWRMAVALEQCAASLVDVRPAENESDIETALRYWLSCTSAPSSAFGQSMTATMAYASTRELRAVAARHLNSSRTVVAHAERYPPTETQP